MSENFSTNEFGNLGPLLQTPELPDIGPEAREGRDSLERLNAKLDEAVKDFSPDKQAILRSAILFWHDHLDESHSLSQNLDSPEGSFLHGMMHRREPDYGNAAYWFRRVGSHPVYIVLGKRVLEQFPDCPEIPARKLAPGGVWDPFAFIDLCRETGAGRGPGRDLLKKVQRIEFETLLEHIC